MQNKMELKIMNLKNYNPRIQERKTRREKVLDNAQKLFEDIENSEFDSEFD